MKKQLLALSALFGTLFASAASLQPGSTATETRQNLQSALDTAARTGGTVTLGAGVFQIDAQLALTNGVTLVGQGWEKTVIKPASGKSIRCVTLAGGSRLEGVTLTGATQSGALVTDGTISWCCISNNTVSSKAGAGVSFTSGQGSVDHSLFVNNRVSGGWGAAIGAQTPVGPITVDSCLLYGNAANNGSGGGIGLPGSIGYDCTVRNCTIVGNTGAYYGPGVFRSGDGGAGKVILINTLVAGNKKGTNERNLDTNSNLNTDSSRNCWFGLKEDLAGSVPNSFYGAPSFVNAAANDYRLAAGSLAIRTGVAYAALGTDLAGIAYDEHPSIGCYEYGRVKCPSGLQLVYRATAETAPAGSASVVASTSAAATWFDADVASLSKWPTDGSAVTVQGQGYWFGTRNAMLSDGSLAVASVDAKGLVFSPVRVKSAADVLHAEAVACFTLGTESACGRDDGPLWRDCNGDRLLRSL